MGAALQCCGGARCAGAAPRGDIGSVSDWVLLLCSGARRAGASPHGGISLVGDVVPLR